MNNVTDKRQIGKHLRELVKKNYPSQRQFGAAYLEEIGREIDEVELNRMNNRLSQIFNGKKSIQTDDILIFSDLLGVSCEEILSAGKRRTTTSSHMTNYNIASSHDEEIWERYLKREDKLFLNSDEYGKTVIDYAMEFKNYHFIKWLMDNEYIWLVDNSEYHHYGYSYGGGTSIEKRLPWKMDNAVPLQVEYEDRIRTGVLALAIENEDYPMLDELLARETPFLHRVGIFNNGDDAYQYYNPDYIDAIAHTTENILDYFSKEFQVVNDSKWENTFIYPFIGEVIDTLIEAGETKKAKMLAERALKHNQTTFKELEAKLSEAYADLCSEWQDKLTSEFLDDKWKVELKKTLRIDVSAYINYSEKNKIVSFFYGKGKEEPPIRFATNLVKVNSSGVKSPLENLLLEINTWYEQIAVLKEKWREQ